MTKWVYLFSEGNAQMSDLLGGKGAGLAEMVNAGLLKNIPQVLLERIIRRQPGGEGGANKHQKQNDKTENHYLPLKKYPDEPPPLIDPRGHLADIN